jgi:NADH-quinone oxidoreductase subunit L
MGGLARRMPQTAIVFLVGTLSLAGLPFFAGFMSKEAILGATWAAGLTAPFGMLTLAAFLTAFYMFRVVFLTFFGAARHGDGHGAVPHDPPALMSLPLWILATLSLVIGGWTTLVHGEPMFEVPGWLAAVAIGVAVAGIGLAWLTYQRQVVSADVLGRAMGPLRTAALAGFWVDDVLLALYRGGALALPRLVGWLDRYIVDGIVNAVSAWTVMSGDALRRIQTGRVQEYLLGVSVGVLVLLWWLRATL